ncbi:hypothetical protein EXIGLDRAFT_448547 [Exidia glandulosa HHB12029]|uniref:Uncharacterized protein n=1 Tax=Exidia glandulosa HHB12029 TaxID=1314781 RepID=A0A165B4S5_EXIGL|nr:hypothetical protein EXIGLDRAFT_448547 [Exidia glandulosa HHB12029]
MGTVSLDMKHYLWAEWLQVGTTDSPWRFLRRARPRQRQIHRTCTCIDDACNGPCCGLYSKLRESPHLLWATICASPHSSSACLGSTFCVVIPLSYLRGVALTGTCYRRVDP